MRFLKNGSFMLIVLTVLTTAGLGQPAYGAGDAEAGKKVWKKCQTCHSLEAGKKKVGPSLAGVFDRQAGTAEGFKFSPDMIAAGESGLIWNEETIAAFVLKDGKNGPKQYIGTFIDKDKARIKMNFRGLKDEAQVDDLVAYLKANAQ